MWESRRDFQEEWEGWETGFMVFHAFHSSSFPTLALSAEAGPKSHVTNIELAELQRGEVDVVEVLFDLLQSDVFSEKDLADEDTALVPTDVACIVHASRLKVLGVDVCLGVARQKSRAWRLQSAWSLVAKRFVGTLMVVDTAELLESLLLRFYRSGGRVRRILLQRSVHPFMASVLLGLTWLDTFMQDAQPMPVQRQP